MTRSRVFLIVPVAAFFGFLIYRIVAEGGLTGGVIVETLSTPISIVLIVLAVIVFRNDRRSRSD